MAIEDPSTYAEWFWKHSVDADRLHSEEIEKIYAPIVTAIIDSPEIKEFIPDTLKPFYENLKSPTTQGVDALQLTTTTALTRVWNLFAGEEVSRPAMYAAKAKNATLRITADMAATLTQRKLMTPKFYEIYAGYEGYNEEQAKFFYNSRLPYPPIPDIITAIRYLKYPEYPKEFAQKKFDISEDDWSIWDWMTYQRLTTEQVQSLHVRGLLEEEPTNDELGRLGWQEKDKMLLHHLAYEIPNAMLMLQGDLMQGLEEQKIAEDIVKAGIHPDHAITYVNAVLTKPATEDIIAYELRRDPSLSNLDTELRRIGIHPNYNDLYKKLAYQIPPVADIITMAVREAFTPDIAARFGQYQDLPSEFVEWVGKKGLSKEWAERYWAAHWSLPSVQQGFEMLHRGIIGEPDMYMLMRALDIMPYWRNKLIAMAFRPLTRVDVRRMYGLGTLDEAGINKAYRDLGYNDYNAGKMTDFTIRWTRQTQSRFSSGDVVKAYTNYLIGSGEASSILRDIGIRSEEVANIIEKADHKRKWATKTETIDAIKNLYKKGKYSDGEAVTELGKLNLPQNYIETQLQQWQAKSAAETVATWTTAQTLSFVTKGLITKERARKEFEDLGYDTEHINVYIASVKPAPD